MVNRILHIVGSMDRAGAETMLMNLYRNIDRSKCQFDYLYFTDKVCDYDSEILNLGGRIIRLSPKKYKNSIQRYFGIRKVLRNSNYRIVHCHMLLNNAFSILAAKHENIPIRISHSHNTSNSSDGTLVGFFYRNISKCIINKYATNFIGCGQAAFNYLHSADKDGFILPNSVNTTHLARVGKEEYREDVSTIRLIQVGRLSEVKNCFYSISIAKELLKRGVKFQLYFIGRGNLESELSFKIKDEKLTENVFLLGIREDIPSLMAKADLLIMPSFHEGFPVVLVESQSVGLPAIVSSNISNEVDLDVDLISFLDIQPSSIDLWVEKILENKDRRKYFAFNDSVERVEKIKRKGFDEKENVKRLMDYYDEFL